MNKQIGCVLFSAALVAGCADDASDVGEVDEAVSSLDTAPHGHGGGIFNKFAGPDGEAKGGGGGHTVAISYHGGPVMLGTPNLYYIWYGNWSAGATDQAQLVAFADGIGGTPYELINATYHDGSNRFVTGAARYGGATSDGGSVGSSNLSDAQILQIVQNNLAAFNGGVVDPNGIYFVLTAKNVTKSGFCTSYCGWHTHATVGAQDLKYSFVGAPSQCPASCEQQSPGPNGTPDADGMASIIAHEMEEAISDPDLNAWYDRRGNENADKCAWTFGTTQTASNGAAYNQSFGGYNWLIQRNWNASSQRCERVVGSPN